MDRNDFEAIERFCEGKMTEEEKQDFEEALSKDQTLSNEMKNYLVSRTAIAMASNERLKARLDILGKSHDLHITPKKNYIPYLPVAAGISLFIGLGFIITQYLRGPLTSQEIYLSYYKSPDVYDYSVRSSENDSSLFIWHTALNYFSQKEYSKALEKLNRLTEIQYAEMLPDAYFLMAICLMEAEDYGKALQALDQAGPESNYNVEIPYYKALCLIKMDKRSEAADLLEEIIQTRDHPYKRNARGILRKLK